MTYLEKIKQENPDWDDDTIRDYVNNECPNFDSPCPMDYKPLVDCKYCWNREIPGTETINEREEKKMETTTTKKTKAQLLEEIADLKKQVEHMNRYKQYEECATDFAAMRKAFENEGFSHEEAFALMKLMVESAAKMARH